MTFYYIYSHNFGLNCRFLDECVLPAFEGHNVTFLCPQSISGSECTRDSTDVRNYVKLCFCNELDKKQTQSQFILAPYHQKYVLLLPYTTF